MINNILNIQMKMYLKLLIKNKNYNSIYKDNKY